MTWGVRDLTVRYQDRNVVANATLLVDPGMVSCVVGGDGAGKTTTLRALVGMAPVQTGQVLRPKAHQLGYLSAGTGVYLDLTVQENLDFIAAAYGLRGQKYQNRRSELLEHTGLASVVNWLAARLSGGTRQKLGVAMAMLHEPELLVLDEPTTGVDPPSRAEIARLIAKAAAVGTAVVFATSYLDEAERASRVLVLDAGQSLITGTPIQITATAAGQVWSVAQRPKDMFSWRRADGWRLWNPHKCPEYARAVCSDLQDAVIVAALKHREKTE